MGIRKLYASELRRKLQTLEIRWPDYVKLYVWDGFLILINTKNDNEIICSFPDIPCGSGLGTTKMDHKKIVHFVPSEEE